MATTTVLALGAAEVAVRVTAPQQLIQIRPDIWQPADTVGYLHRLNVRTEINTGERTVTFRTDREGFRVGARGRREAELEVLLLGDSFMEALQVEYEQSVAGLLDVMPPGTLGASLAVRNAAVGGWGPSHYYLRARQLLSSDSFDLVLVAVFVGNDAAARRVSYFPPRPPVERHHLRWPGTLRRAEVVDAWLAPLNDFLETRSHLFILARANLTTLRMKLGLTSMRFPIEYSRTEASSVRWRVTGELLADIAGLAAETGAPTMFVLVPEAFQVDATEFHRYVQGYRLDTTAVDLEQPTRLLRQELEHRHLTVVDPLPAFREAHRTGAVLFGEVDAHLSPEGHALLAATLRPAITVVLGHTRRDSSHTGRCPEAGTAPCSRVSSRAEAGEGPPAGNRLVQPGGTNHP